jgi:dipeptidyl aminopeptidase/acylaminoacyl peptidase
MRRTLLLLSLLLAASLSAQQTPPPPLQLTIDTIMRGPGLYGYSPKNVRWSPDSQRVFFEWKQWTDPIENDFDTWVAGRDGSGLRKLSEEEAKDATPLRGSDTRDRKRIVFIDQGDVFIYDGAKRRNLTSTAAAESHPRFTRDERHVAFVRDNNLFVLSLDDGSLVQLTNIVMAGEKGPNADLWNEKDKKGTESQEYLKAEERKLLGIVDRRAKKREEDEAKRKREHPIRPLELQKGESIADLQLSGDGKYVIALINVESEKGKKTIVPAYVTESAYTEDIKARLKVGDREASTKIASLSTANGDVKYMKTGLQPLAPIPVLTTIPTAAATATGEAVAPRTEQAASAKSSAAEGQKSEAVTERTEGASKTTAAAAKEREVSFDTLIWSEDGSKVVIPVQAQDNKDWWLMALDPATGGTRILATEHDARWVRQADASIGFLGDNETLFYLSEATGWMQLYTVAYSGGTPRQLTSGNFEIDDATLSTDRKSFYLTSSEESPYERHLYRMPVGGGMRTKVTSTPGDHEALVSPDGQLFAEVYSYTNKPPELFVSKNAPGAAAQKVTASPAPEFFTYPWLDVPIVTIPARDGVQVPARIYKPDGWQRGGPAVVFVHGAGYLQNVHRFWSNYSREFIFHHFLMEHGYVVLDIDYRASAGHGREWRTAIYRHMGGIDLDDQVDAAKWLAAEVGVDPKRIGIYGGSYGGFITLMAMFTQPGVFAAGAALRPVTDWAHYNDGYTSSILNRPQDDPEAYRRSSPIYFAEGLKGPLLICHGVVDTNVHYQDTVRLAQRLIELRKENWNVAFYPVENHGFLEPTSWADEYKRIYGLFERSLK